MMAWKRPEIESRAYDCLQSLSMPEGWGMDVLVVGSEGKRSRDAAESRGFLYAEFPNKPLGAKANRRLHLARELEWDYLWDWATGAVCTNGFLSLYAEYVHRGADRIGLWDLWHYDVDANECFFFSGYNGRRRDSLGLGRLTSRKAIEDCQWQLWDDEQERCLDAAMHQRLCLAGYRNEGLVYCGDELALALRSALNVTDIRKYRGDEIKKVEAPPSRVRLLIRGKA